MGVSESVFVRSINLNFLRSSMGERREQERNREEKGASRAGGMQRRLDLQLRKN